MRDTREKRYFISMRRSAISLLFLGTCSLSGCSLNIFKPQSQNEKRLQENVQYATTLFQQEAPEALPTPLDSGSMLNCSLAAIDSLFIEQVKPAPSLDEAYTTLKNEAKRYLDKTPITHIPCIVSKGSKALSLEKFSPMSGEVCQRAFVNQYLETHTFKKMKFPILRGIEVVRKETPSLFLLSSFDTGTNFASLVTSRTQSELEKIFSLLGEALAEVHNSTPREQHPLSRQWLDSIHNLLNSFSHRYQISPRPLSEAAQYLADCVYRIMSAYEKHKKTFSIGLALGNTDLENFLLLDKNHVLFLKPSAIGASLPSSSNAKPSGLISYDYCRMWHDLTLVGAGKLTQNNLRAIVQAWESGYMKVQQQKPTKDEILFFSSIDLIHRIEECHINNSSSISLSLLEAELVQWSESLKKMREKNERKKQS